MQRDERVGIEQRMAAAEADLRQARAFAHQDGKRARADLGIERPVIAGLDAVKATRPVGDDAGEHVQAPGRALRVGGGGNVGRKRQALDQGNDIDAIGLQHRAVADLELVQLQLVDALRDGGARAGQEARAHPVGDGAEPQVETRRLDLVGNERLLRQDGAALGERRDHPIRQNAFVVGRQVERHDSSDTWRL